VGGCAVVGEFLSGKCVRRHCVLFGALIGISEDAGQDVIMSEQVDSPIW